MAYPYTLRFPYAVELTSKTGAITHGFIAEIDAELVVEYEDTDNWEVVGLRFEQTKYSPEFEVTPKSDPTLWALIERALDLDDKAVCAKVRDQIVEAYCDMRDERGDMEYDLRAERMEFGR